MLLREERQQVAAYGRELVAAGLTVGSGGNLSVIDSRRERVAIGPSGLPYADVRAEDVVVLDLHGRVLEGGRSPSSELALHLELYRTRQDAGAVVHTHSVFATTLACLGWEIPAVHYLVGFAGRRVPLAPYATFGSPELARSASSSMGNSNAVLLANHGVVAVGNDLPAAFRVAEEVEFVARIYYQARCAGKPTILSDEEMERVIERFRTYGKQADPPDTG